MTTRIKKQCWAYDTANHRCEKNASHTGNHSITYSWTDDECSAPFVVAKPETQPDIKQTMIKDIITKCTACLHQHKDGACKCGCYTQIG
jgi:hypothetical protein